MESTIFNGKLRFKEENPRLRFQKARRLTYEKAMWLEADPEQKATIASERPEGEHRVCMVSNLLLPLKSNGEYRTAFDGTSLDAHMVDEVNIIPDVEAIWRALDPRSWSTRRLIPRTASIIWLWKQRRAGTSSSLASSRLSYGDGS